MTSYLQLLGAAGPDSPPSLLLFFDNSRYLINAPEGTQRLATQHQIRLSKLHHILLTRSSTLTLGGLPGLAITLADLGVKRLTVSGGEGGVGGVMRGVRLFSVRRGMEVEVREMRDGEESKDERVSIKAVVMGQVTRRMHTRVDEQRRANAETMQVDGMDGTLQPPEKRFRAEEKSNPYHSEDDLAIASSASSCAAVDQLLPLVPSHSTNHPVRPSSPASFEPAVTTPFTVASPVLSFIFSLASTPGKFDPVRAKALGLKPGPLYAQLKAGQQVWLEEERKENETELHKEHKDDSESVERRGRYVSPHECVGPVRLGAEVAVVDIPWQRTSSRLHRWVQRLRHNSAFLPYHTSSSSTSSLPASTQPHLTAIVHLCGMAVLTHPLYVEWMRLFGPRTQHVLVNHVLAVPRSVFISSEQHHQKLQTLSHSLFCCSSSLTSLPTSSAAAIMNGLDVPVSSVVGETLMRINLLPQAGSAERESVSDVPAAENGDEHEWSERMEQYKREAWTKLCLADSREGHSSSLSLSLTSLPVSPYSHLPLVLPSPSEELHTAAPPVGFIPDPRIIRRLALLPRTHSPHLTFLGTGSAMPSKYRNVTGIFFHPGHPVQPDAALPTMPPTAEPTTGRATNELLGGWLLDCGEGTVGQCVRKWGVAGARDVLGALRVVFISHMHADHHLGLPTVIGLYAQEERKRRATGEAARRLIVVGPRKLVAWLSVHWQHTYEEDTCDVDDGANDAGGSIRQNEMEDMDDGADVLDDDLFDFIDFFANHTLMFTPHPLSPLLASFPLPFSMSTIPVRHCPDSYAVSLHTLATPSHSPSTSAALLSYKLVYSGDTLPCQSLVDGGSCATLLLHESTFEDGMEVEARDKRHSTARQAVQVAIKMRAERTILTHFSQRYPKLADVSGGGVSGGGGVSDGASSWMSERCGIAFDLMSVDWCDLYWLPKLTPAFADLLADDTEDEGSEHSEQQQATGPEQHSTTVNARSALSKEKRAGAVDKALAPSTNGSNLSGKRKNAHVALQA